MRIIIIGYGNWGSRVAKIIHNNLSFINISILSFNSEKEASEEGFNIMSGFSKLKSSDKCYITSHSSRHFDDLSHIREVTNADCLIEKPFVSSKKTSHTQ